MKKTNCNLLCQHAYIAALLLVLLLTGCGKAGMPTPQDSSKLFELTKTEAIAVNNTITFSGVLTGEFNNMEALRLELTPVNGPEDCPGCPFIPAEVHLLDKKDITINEKTGEFSFSYGARKATAYRWRLAGISKFNTTPHSITIDKLLVMP